MTTFLWIVAAIAAGFAAGWMLRDARDPITLEEQRRICRKKAEDDLRELENQHRKDIAQLEGNHAWEIRRLTARAEDAEAIAGRYKGGYKRALKKLGNYRQRLARAKQTIQAAGLGERDEEKDGKAKLNTVQAVVDQAQAKIPGIDSMALETVRSYVEREFRTRGAKAGPDILEEVLTGEQFGE